MRISAYGKPKDERTTHEKWCDKMVEKASTPYRFGGYRTPQKPQPIGVKRNNYTLVTLFGIFTGWLKLEHPSNA